MRRALLIVIVFAGSLLGLSGAAQAIVVDMNALGHTSVPFNPSGQSGSYGVALVPGSCGDLQIGGTCSVLASSGIPTVTSSAPCSDPALTSDLSLPDTGICSHGGAVMNGNETFALTWDPHRGYYSVARGYVEQFLRDAADASGTRGSPYAVTSQYTGANGRALNNSRYGGGCIDYGGAGGSACEFGSPTGAGHDYPANGCHPAGDSFTSPFLVGTNSVCLTDSQLEGEVSAMVTQAGMLGRTQPGYTPLVTLLLPPGVEACLDATSKLCSANGSLTPPPPRLTTSATGGKLAAGTYNVEITYTTAGGESLSSAAESVTTGSTTSSGSTSTITIESPPQANGATGWYAYVTGPDGTTFSRQQGLTPVGSALTLTAVASGGQPPPHPLFLCSYHSRVNVGGTEVAYVVQPWTAGTACDEPGLPEPPDPLSDPVGFSQNVGMRLVNPLSQAHIASIVNPGLNGWFALDGAEITDNGVNGYACHPLGIGYDTVSVGSGSYVLQREFNNAGAIESEPVTYSGCAPNVILSPAFVMPTSVNQGREAQFDGSATASTLIVPNAGYTWSFGDGTGAVGASVVHTFATAGNYTVTLRVTDRGGYVGTVSQTIQVLEPDGKPAPPQGPAAPRLQVRMLLMPQSLRQVLRHGISAILSSNEAGDGFASVLISRAAARRAKIKTGSARFVVVGRGTVSGIKDGRISLRLRLPRATATKLKHLEHLTLTIRLTLISTTGQRVGLAIAGSY
jgi:chitodextrinase